MQSRRTGLPREELEEGGKETKVRKELFISVEEIEANHRALRRCRSCGAYERVFDLFNGGARCERCAKRAERENEDRENGNLNAAFTV